MDHYDNNNGYQYTSGPNPGQFQTGSAGSMIPAGNAAQEDPCSGRRRRTPGGKKKSRPVVLTKTSLTAVILLCVFLSSAFGFGGAMLAGSSMGTPSSTVQKNTAGADAAGFNLQAATGSAMTVQEITSKAKDSVVEIKTESVQADTWMQQYVTQGAGSGVIIKSSGYILTNNHVIENAGKITVTVRDSRQYEAKPVATDSDTDLAVLKINAENLPAAAMGNSDQLHVGDMAVAIGNPLGELGGTVTAGIISALDRSLSINGKTMSLLQTDTSINPGNSGGGLFNQYGQLVGIVVAKSSGSDVEGLGFAIPINRAAEVASQLMDGGYVRGKPSTGITYVDMGSQQDSGMFGGFFGEDSFRQSAGSIYVKEITGKNAKRAGFKVGDLVYSVDGKEIDSMETLSSVITSHKVGDKVTYIVLRDGQAVEIELKLSEKTSS